MKELITQTIQHGSVYLALKQRAFTVAQLIRHLPEMDYNERSYIAYRQACLLGSDDDQYISDDDQSTEARHFLTLVPHEMYVAIFVLSGRKSRETDTDIVLAMNEGLRRLALDQTFSRKAHLLCDSLNVTKVINEDIPLLVQSRSNLLLSMVRKSPQHFRSVTTEDFIQADFLEEVPQGSHPERLIKRCFFLKQEAPAYWQLVTSKLYDQFLGRVISEGGFQHYNREAFLTAASLIPSLTQGIRLDNLSELAFRLLVLPTTMAGYYLGFPIHLQEPRRATILQLITQVSQLGPEEYTNRLQALQEREAQHHYIGVGVNVPLTKGNEHDVIHENVFRYGPFDRLGMTTDNVVFYFTRPEFGNLLEKQTNPWNNTKLSRMVVEQVRCRVKIARLLNLPKPLPIDQLLETLVQAPPSNGRRSTRSSVGQPPRLRIGSIPRRRMFVTPDPVGANGPDPEDFEDEADLEEDVDNEIANVFRNFFGGMIPPQPGQPQPGQPRHQTPIQPPNAQQMPNDFFHQIFQFGVGRTPPGRSPQ